MMAPRPKDPDPKDPDPKDPPTEPPYIPGGTDPNKPPNPTEPGHPLIPDGDGWIELDDDGIPLGRWEWGPDGEWIFDRFPPLGGMPKTRR